MVFETTCLSIFLAVVIVVLFLFLSRFKRPKPNLPPGPRPWPILGHLPYLLFTKEEPQFVFERWARQYGKIMTLELGGQTAVVLNDLDLIKSCYQSDTFNGRPKLSTFEIAFGAGAGNLHMKALLY